jgi:23S rRNA pseudouridine1911/1915/1917 synthase
MRNDGFEYREQIGAEADGRPIEDYLAHRYRHSSRADWLVRLSEGRILLDSQPAEAGMTVRRGQSLVWQRPPWVEPEAPLDYEVVHEDEELVAVDKPAGLPTLPGAGFLQSTLLYLVRAHAPDAYPLHRLGRWTSGLVLFAKTAGARAELTRQWMQRTVGKCYRALAAGIPAKQRFVITDPIGPVPHPLIGSVHAATADGRPARTRAEVVEARESCFLCDVEIETGRPHQIRIHLAAAGHPLVGDPLYAMGGRPRPGSRVLPGDPGYKLHASELAVRHPGSGMRVTLSCPPPEELRAS